MNWQKYSNDVRTFMLRLVFTEGQPGNIKLTSPLHFTLHITIKHHPHIMTMQSLFILILLHLLSNWPTWDADHCIMIVRWMEDPLLVSDLLMTRGWSHWGEDVVSGVNVWPLDWNTQKPESIVCWRKCGKTVASLRLLTWIKTGLTINNDCTWIKILWHLMSAVG